MAPSATFAQLSILCFAMRLELKLKVALNLLLDIERGRISSTASRGFRDQSFAKVVDLLKPSLYAVNNRSANSRTGGPPSILANSFSELVQVRGSSAHPAARRFHGSQRPLIGPNQRPSTSGNNVLEDAGRHRGISASFSLRAMATGCLGPSCLSTSRTTSDMSKGLEQGRNFLRFEFFARSGCAVNARPQAMREFG